MTPLESALMIIDKADSRGFPIRLFGGLAFKVVCPSASHHRFNRQTKDIDFMARRSDSKKVIKLMEDLGFKPRDIFNKLAMGQRMIYYDMAHNRRIDIFLDKLVMCHTLDFSKRLLPGMKTLPITDLAMTKLQVIEMTNKEYNDLLLLFHDFDINTDGINGAMIAKECARNWGLYATFNKSIDRLVQKAEEPALSRIKTLKKMIDDEPKTLGWKMRASIGEKAKWYETPDSDSDEMLA